MTNWKPGMKAVCIQQTWWKALNVPGIGPAKGDVVEVKDVWLREHPKGKEFGLITMLKLTSWANSYSASGFRPLLGDEQEALDAIEEEVKETELIEA